MSTTLERPVRHGILTKRSISKSRTTLHAKFQERWFVLTGDTLTYHTPNGQTVSSPHCNLFVCPWVCVRKKCSPLEVKVYFFWTVSSGAIDMLGKQKFLQQT